MKRSLTLVILLTALLPTLAYARSGEEVYEKTCLSCHKFGIAGAPKFGNSDDWAPRVKKGMDALYDSALNGKGAMPAKGGNRVLTDEEVKAAVDYMVEHSK